MTHEYLISRLMRENEVLYKELRFYIAMDIQRSWDEISDEDADAAAVKEIAWLIEHNEGAE